ncbi:M23 family metallopeptidase [Lachnoclostridium sp. Marseille-P6806]|uniref:M23 family metallopeptidase n=1 Tax=Lachnoclostridium sp. Marseille-P6806 TaxID=2364793 RepID=UPI001F5E9EB7|nr:M23 family metallopeptidase [Lachnoclostridium sp. Marseille-P6806]
MKTIHQRQIHLWALAATVAAFFVSLFFLPQYSPGQMGGSNLFTVMLDGEEVGTLGSEAEARSALIEARRELAEEYMEEAAAAAAVAGEDEETARNTALYYAEAELEARGEEVLWGRVDSRRAVTDRMKEVLAARQETTLQRCYTVKFGSNILNLASKAEVLSLFSSALRQYDEDEGYLVELTPDTSREFYALTTEIRSVREQEQIEEKEQSLPTAGIITRLSDVLNSTEPAVGRNFEDYMLGLVKIGFRQKIEVVESYMPAQGIMSLDAALGQVLADRLEKQVYEVQAGDTLSGIAAHYDLTVADVLAMNPNYEDETAMIRIGDEITVTVPEPALSVAYTEQEYYEEDYEEDTIYEDNDDWYTTRQEVIQQPSSGHRRIIALVDYVGDVRTGRTIVKEEIDTAAVPKIVMRGTKVPPTYIWPVSGGYVSSGFGARSAPKAGASHYHQGIDIAVSVGTAVMASSAGTVVSAGWQSGYGYVVYIQHADGRQTRYGHLSKILVSSGQSVTQGQKIALSGNTGNSTGPHLHFEIRINGTAVNPLSYMN